jgi:anti-repressor protein
MNIEIFKNSEFGAVRVIEENGEPYFVGKEVADILGYEKTSKMYARLDDDEKETTTLQFGASYQKSIIINESGLYNAILGSRKETAKKFKKWVTSEVLPAIRKHGIYATPQTIENMIANPDFAIELLQKLKAEQEAKRKLENKLIEVKPKVEYAEAIEKTENSIDLGKYAKIIAKRLEKHMGRNTLFKMLREHKILMKDNIPYQKYIDKGYFELVETTYYKGDELCTGFKTLITGKGQEKIYHIIKNLIKKAS